MLRGLGRMSDDGTDAPLSRRVPGSNRSGPRQPVSKKLTDSTVSRIQAAIDAEHAADMPLQREPSTEPLPRVTESGPAGQRAEKALRSEEALRATKALRDEEERRAAEELQAAEAPRAAGQIGATGEPRHARELSPVGELAPAAELPPADEPWSPEATHAAGQLRGAQTPRAGQRRRTEESVSAAGSCPRSQ